MTVEIAVIGGGMVGAAIAYGLASRGQRVVMLDGKDRDFRAASANFGLVWLQGKGMDMPAYQRLTRSAVDLWRGFDNELTDAAGIDLQFEGRGGLKICLGQKEFEERGARLLGLHNQMGGEADWEMLDRGALEKFLPGLRFGPDVAGASFGHRDGHANPLRLLAALHAAILRKGGEVRGGVTVRSVTSDGGQFTIAADGERFSAQRVVIAAGLGSGPLAAQVGLDVPLRPQRGQILVTERLLPFLPLPLHDLRQTAEGTVMIGATQDEAGYDASTTMDAAISLSARAIRCLPDLRNVTLVRQWAGLRIMTPDGCPIYAQSQSHPGAFVALCHSGVTLAPLHAGLFAQGVAAGQLPAALDAFHHRRFDVPTAA
jgi:glycine/D-amino acid oxidase-like deaminating enzyme